MIEPALPSPDVPPSVCLDCGHPLKNLFCPQCGQKSTDPTQTSLKELLRESLGNWFGLDSRIGRTLPLLLLKPGLLTREYLQGRRTRYVPPLRLFLVMSVVMITVLSLTQVSIVQIDGDQPENSPGGLTLRVDPGDSNEALRESEPKNEVPDAETPGETDEDLPGSVGRKIQNTGVEELNRAVIRYLPQGLFFLAPFLGFYLWVLFRKKFAYYAPHFIFSLHFHAFAYALIALTQGLIFGLGPRSDDPLSVLMLLVLTGYFYRALRGFYRISWWKAVAVLVVLSLVQLVTLLFILISIFVFVLWVI